MIFLMDGNSPITTPKKKLSLASVNGEWWIDDYGGVQYADGDVGDMNHEMIVIDHARGEFGYSDDTGESWDSYIVGKAEEYVNDLIDQDPEIREEALADFNNYPTSFIDKAFREEYERDYGDDEFDEKWAVANDRTDVRQYAMEKLGWIRVAGPVIQVHRLDDRTLSNMVRGLEEIFSQTGTEEGDEGYFDIEITASRKYMTGVPFDAIKSARRSGSVGELIEYSRGPWAFSSSRKAPAIMGAEEQIIISQFTGQRNVDRMTKRDNDAKPLSEEENKRLSQLVAKVDAAGTPSVLSEQEYKEYEDLGLRHNLTMGMSGDVLLPTAIKPWITQ